MSERRSTDRPGPSERRSFPRPPLWLNLLLLLLGIGGLAYARMHRQRVATDFADVITEQARTPADVRRMKDELAEMDLSRGSLQRDLEGRLKFAASLKSEDFYLSIDTSARKLRFYYGDTWTFLPIKGAFPVEAKLVHYAWPVPEWVYAMNGQPIPQTLPTVPDGLGAYALLLPNGYAIHTPPSAASPLQGAKPGSYLVAEDVLMAIWPRIHAGTQVYIF
jgi:hypothetical protein